MQPGFSAFICLQFGILAPLKASRGPSGIRGADAKEQSLKEHKKLLKRPEKQPRLAPDTANLWRAAGSRREAESDPRKTHSASTGMGGSRSPRSPWLRRQLHSQSPKLPPGFPSLRLGRFKGRDPVTLRPHLRPITALTWRLETEAPPILH